MWFDLVFCSSVVSLVLLIWFLSEAFIEYATAIGGEKFFKISDYKEKQKERATLDYHSYLLESHSSFFIRLITCPLCFSFWVSLTTTLLATDSMLIFPMVNLSGLVGYKLISNLLES
tara:strand:- start:846 stop:1196 length:351 start_codon:yes stop_codon:yes gene_type:complete